MTHDQHNHSAGSRVTSLSGLNTDIPPMRDLWPGIEARIASEVPRGSGNEQGSSRLRGTPSRWLAMAAIVSALAVGVWLGRNALPVREGTAPVATPANGSLLPAAFVTNPAYVKQREALLASYEAQLRALPPQTRDKVVASLAAIHKSMQDIQEALGREPGNALLQELLVNTYQDEMRVLTAVHEAGDVRKEI